VLQRVTALRRLRPFLGYQGRGTPPHHILCGEAAFLTAALECAASVVGKVERPFLSLRVIKFSVGDGCFL
jgi:hypothetical protein